MKDQDKAKLVSGLGPSSHDVQHTELNHHRTNAPLSRTESSLQHDIQPSLEDPDEDSIQFTQDNKRRRISPDSKETEALELTGLDLPDASNDGNTAPYRGDESATQTNDRGNN